MSIQSTNYTIGEGFVHFFGLNKSTGLIILFIIWKGHKKKIGSKNGDVKTPLCFSLPVCMWIHFRPTPLMRSCAIRLTLNLWLLVLKNSKLMVPGPKNL